MAIYHASMKPVTRASGRSAVASAAYRAGERLTNERDGITHDFTRKEGVEHAEIVLPDGVSAEWAKSREKLWNAAEFAESRKDARVAREFEIALPHELTAEQRLELTREFAQDLANRYGAGVDFAIHRPHDASDVRNHHAHLLMTTRQVNEEGLGEKTFIERENKWLLKNDLPTSHMQLRDIRQSFEQMTNSHLARAGLDIRVDHRSHAERGLEIEPTEHAGVHATQMERRGLDVSRARLDEDAAKRNADLIREKPEQVLAIITGEKSVFDRHDIARTLHRYINDDAQAFQNAFATVMSSPALVELQAERADATTGEIELARYSTREMVDLESSMANSAERLHQAQNHGVDRRLVERAIGRQDAAIRSSVSSDTAGKVERGELDSGERDRRIGAARLSDEQRAAIEHITGPERIAAVVGYAGAGKSTMLAAAREAWEAQGYQVHGAALSGKAAEGLEESSGIASRTLASWEMGWQNDRHQLGRGDVFVIDEAGMVGSRQLARFVGEAEKSGAKIVLVGDHEQLQAIGAGAPFRAIAEQIGHAELSEIRRQRVDWQREASVSFATHKTADGLAAYRQSGDIRFSETGEGARGEIVRDYLADREQRPDGTRVAMAHRRADVRAINADIRSALQDSQRLGRGEEGGEVSFQTNDGRRAFAPGDRLVFLENDRDLGVKNGMLGTVQTVEPDAIQVQLDGGAGRGRNNDRIVTIPTKTYQSFDHGYATTIHKTQGATVDRALVMASQTMDRHLTYVAMTRHRDGVQLYVAKDEFNDRKAGKLVEHGVAPYEHRAANRDSYFVTLENDKGQRHTTWGVDLERAMKDAAQEIGAKIGLGHAGSETVQLPNGKTAERNSWKVHGADELAFKALGDRLGRSGVKETTLDYTKDFAGRRGIAEQIGIRSEIEVDRAAMQRQDQRSPAAHPAREQQDRDAVETGVHDERLRLQVGPVRGREDPGSDRSDNRQQAKRRSAFDGLKLSRGAAGDKSQTPARSEKGQEPPQKVETQRRGMFDGLKLRAGERGSLSLSQQRSKDGSLRISPVPEKQDQERQSDRLRPMSGFEQSVDRFARAWSAAAKMDREGLPVLEGQKSELQQAGQQLDQQRPGSPNLMVSAMRNDPQTEQAMHQLSGRERVGQLVAGMDRERALQADPNVRADRLINTWQKLQAERQNLQGWQHDEARGKVEGQMRKVADVIERDPQVESIVRSRSKEIGISHVRQEQNVARAMEQQISRGRSQGLER
ncbi:MULTISPECIES: Ti-type conjugative transfer relaxase TraA [Agrobacterium]|uniref:Ti-type conjugative transfer relaxase TraA n=5 Tax=Pseudomonadota TaxID=1224 RepID=A0A9X3KTH4_9HYPH|nr:MULTISPECIES: Ti-type conjugative transfer relaxase TraA [Agrobacterium]SOC89981.1 Ti-type conjugative transfer relaxase TraA [Ensifer adhaerens]MCZ7854915.1 Ti-type conjugative transfer relaxase TraA [Agrobacterium salinitolerans]MCZ7859617.1 Ti-type conjugative transfer relaxase TraA [Agrobacterium salinitolerans]MCZ7889749.1 Ti-type conjugative transfer relaxase TraA [Agrobacterium salinitolerans]MCZ7894665.1 Ti-type conjugative transfer relaxase TraA [Agrobacterium salinitolerans]